MWPFHACVHPHREIENERRFLAGRNRRGTHDRVSRSAPFQDFDRGLGEGHDHGPSILEHPLAAYRRVQRYTPKIGKAFPHLQTGDRHWPAWHCIRRSTIRANLARCRRVIRTTTRLQRECDGRDCGEPGENEYHSLPDPTTMLPRPTLILHFVCPEGVSVGRPYLA